MTGNNRQNGTKSVKARRPQARTHRAQPSNAYKTNKNDEPPAKRRKLNPKTVGGTRSVKAHRAQPSNAYKTNKENEPPAKRRKLNPKPKVKSD